MKNKKYISILLMMVSTFTAFSQTVVEIPPLFEYPIAPENIESLDAKCDYIVKNFWNNFNFKSKQAVDQYALNEAFQVYTTAFQFASFKEVDSSIDKLLKNLSGNKILFLQFMKAAEENLYGPRAQYWSDPLYLKFLNSLIKDKKIPQNRKEKYIRQQKALTASKVGNEAPEFWFEDRERASKRYFPMSTPTLLVFGNPDNTDWRLERIRWDSNLSLSEAIDKGKVNILFIVPGNIPNWQNNVENYNKKWTVGQSENIAEIYDVRMNPAIYLIGPDGKILEKNIRVSDAVNLLLDQAN